MDHMVLFTLWALFVIIESLVPSIYEINSVSGFVPCYLVSY